MNDYAVWMDFDGVQAVEVVQASSAYEAAALVQKIDSAHPILRVVQVS